MVMVAIGAVAVWLFSLDRAEPALVGIGLLSLVALGFVVKPGRGRWYGLGVVCTFLALFLGLVQGPLVEGASTGYCDSVFGPFDPGHSFPDDAPADTEERCQEIRRDRTALMSTLGIVGLIALGLSLGSPRATSPADDSSASALH
ncbi:hypothetical protein [Nocardioides campestrisoli]|uniref:hypothetical protein n=1 Tax=Nocardioides campestrisoli TaxID=2736757 RepID=UPI00163D8B4C|nr:hypothetical protein [Nocardioides campestrisoli]